MLIDLAVPRNIAPEAAGVPGVTCYDVDALGRMVAENCRARSQAIDDCERIIDEEVQAFERWVEEAKVRPLIEQMFADVRALAEIELRGTLSRCPDFTDHQRDAVGQLVERLVGKLMHPCVSTMRGEGGVAPGAGRTAEMLAEAFHATRLSFGQRRHEPREFADPAARMI
jgi:glutamyl-tRNA reductase